MTSATVKVHSSREEPATSMLVDTAAVSVTARESATGKLPTRRWISARSATARTRTLCFTTVDTFVRVSRARNRLMSVRCVGRTLSMWSGSIRLDEEVRFHYLSPIYLFFSLLDWIPTYTLTIPTLLSQLSLPLFLYYDTHHS